MDVILWMLCGALVLAAAEFVVLLVCASGKIDKEWQDAMQRRRDDNDIT